MKDIKDLDIVFELGYAVQIGRMYQPVLDGLLVVSAVLNRHNKSLVLSRWETERTTDVITGGILPSNLSFSFLCSNLSANQMNTLWRELTISLETIDKHWTVVYNENLVECYYDINKVFV